MKYKSSKQPETWLTWTKVVLIGVLLGIVLALVAYCYLTILGNQIQAQDHADRVEKEYREKLEKHEIPQR